MAALELKELKVKASCVKRIHKELGYYEKEREREQSKVDAMKAHGVEASDLKQAVRVCTCRATHARGQKKPEQEIWWWSGNGGAERRGADAACLPANL